MKKLYEFLVESINIFEASFSDAPIDVTNCRNYFDEHFHKGKNIPTEFIEYIFNIWKDRFDNNASNVPFRCNGKAAKLGRAYEVYKDDIVDFCKQHNIKVSTDDESIKIEGVTIKWGDGSLKGIRAAAGLSYEQVVINQIVTFIETIAGAYKDGLLDDKLLNEMFDKKDEQHWINMYKQGGFDELLDLYIKNPDIDLHKIVTNTGSGKTHRNDNDELFDDDFVIQKSNIEKVLKDSGEIIADVTINTKTPQYISVKMKAAQLSGVNYQNAIARNKTFKSSVMSNDSYNDVENTKDMIAFNNFCETLGLIPEDVFNKYKDLYNGGIKDNNLEINKNYDPELLGCLFQKLLGGNYWYVKPGVCEYVDYKNAKLKVNISSANISNTGKDITIKGDINGLKCGITFRTDGKGPWPYRLFPKVSVPDLIKKV